MATLRNKRKRAALAKVNCVKLPRKNLAQNSIVPRSQEYYITEAFEEDGGRVTTKFSQEFSRTESRILVALTHLDDFLLNPIIQGYSKIAPETSWNRLRTNQGANEDNSHSDPHPGAGVSQSQTTPNSGPDDTHDTGHSQIFASIKRSFSSSSSSSAITCDQGALFFQEFNMIA